MGSLELDKVSDLKQYAGREVGVSDWFAVSQEDVDLFARATGDHNWIHVDPERAVHESPYRGTIAHGFFTASLIPKLRTRIVDVRNKKTVIFYGLDRLRFPAPLPVGGRVRLRGFLNRVEDIEGGVQTFWTFTFEVEGKEKPTCVAEAIYRYLE